ncbi:MAG: LOW QUALITY PROTEIN: hypothetical protein KVP17_000753 [Porospora cf. gigantea B]|uniref:uncharacterized protein n=1 Tax=Porospora cf. gigantea B TaxID=2853592 RepID=UPI003571CF6C|nr:MAG: LOW QUALITY PROTEIN: hypothetical protein KVP17_000753 [Porospora cf. gigantea B]
MRLDVALWLLSWVRAFPSIAVLGIDDNQRATLPDQAALQDTTGKSISQVLGTRSVVVFRYGTWSDLVAAPQLQNVSSFSPGSDDYIRATSQNKAATSAAADFKKHMMEHHYMDYSHWTKDQVNPGMYGIIGSFVEGGSQPPALFDADFVGTTGAATENDGRALTNVLGVCALEGALVFHVTGRSEDLYSLRCIGDPAICEPINSREFVMVQEVHCPSPISKMLVVLDNGRWLLLGDPAVKKYKGQVVSNDALPPEIASHLTGEGSLVSLAGNAGALCLVAISSFAFALGLPEFGGEAEAVNSVLNVAVNEHGFALLRNNLKVVSWGSYTMAGSTVPISWTNKDVPASIRDGVEGADMVKTIIGRYHCFAAISTQGHVSTWGAGEDLFCTEQALSSPTMTSFQQTASELGNNVRSVFINRGALLAVKKNGDVVTWGQHRYGGEVPTDIIWSSLSAKQKLVEIDVERVRTTEGAFLVCRTDRACFVFGLTGGGLEGRGGQDEFVGPLIQADIQLQEGSDMIFAASNAKYTAIWNGKMETVLSHVPGLGLPLPEEVQRLAPTFAHVLIVMGRKCVLSDWRPLGVCSARCGGGSLSYDRHVVDPGVNVLCDEPIVKTEACHIQPCPRDTDVRRGQTKHSSNSRTLSALRNL